MTLTRLPGSKWWIETDEASEIIGTYNKAQITADINAIGVTLQSIPSQSDDAIDVEWLLGKVDASALTQVRKDRIKVLVNGMYQAYQGDPRQVEIAQLRSKRDALITLRERLV